MKCFKLIEGEQMMKKVIVMMFAFSSSLLFAVDVNFQLDMSNETVSDSGVHIAGNMQGWDPAASEMTDLDADSVYEITFTDLATGDTLLYTFINGNTWSGQEDNTGLSDCGVDNGFGAYNRIWVVGDSAETVGPVCFSSCIGCDEVYVTFQVDMENEDISPDGVHIAGSFQEWDPGATALSDDDGDTVYTVKLPLTIGETIYFKYINGDEWGEDESVPSECADGGNRYHTVGSIDEILPEVCFGSCDPCEGLNLQEADVTFQADMTNMNAQGFDPNIHTIEVRGGFNGWAGGDVMVQVFGDPNTYIFDTTLTVNVGDQIEWKFKANPDSVWNNGGWETGDNRSFEWTGDDIVLDPVEPNILPIGQDLLNDVTISFEVEWIDGTLNVNTGEPFPVKPDTLVFNGSYLNGWYTWGDCMGPGCQTPASPDMPRLTDDDGDDFFTGTLDLPAGHPNLLMGKFGAFYPGIDSLAAVSPNGAIDNEAGFGADYVIVIPVDATTYTYAGRFGENNPDNPWVGIDDEPGLPVVFALLQNYPNPFNPVTAIKFDLAGESDVNLVIYDLLGHEVATLVNDRLNAGYHNVVWNGTDRFGKPVGTGIYFYQITVGNLTSSKKMLLLK